MQVVVEHIMAEIVNLMDKPVAFFGHSVGAIVAFTVAMECEHRKGAKPFLLFASGHCAPHVHDAEKCATYPAVTPSIGNTPPKRGIETEHSTLLR
jgi:surfactin synthase thioesterase subunit